MCIMVAQLQTEMDDQEQLFLDLSLQGEIAMIEVVDLISAAALPGIFEGRTFQNLIKINELHVLRLLPECNTHA